MRIIFLMFLVTVASCEAAAAQNNSINELRQMFDYDQKLPLDVKEVGFRVVGQFQSDTLPDLGTVMVSASMTSIMPARSLDVLPLISLSLLLKASMRAWSSVIGDTGIARSFFLKRYCTPEQ